MRAGKLDRIITLQRSVETKSATGAVTLTWSDLATVKAEIVEQSADEFLTGFGEAQTDAIVFRVRYIADLTTGDRVLYAGTAHDLTAISEIGRRRGLELRCGRST